MELIIFLGVPKWGLLSDISPGFLCEGNWDLNPRPPYAATRVSFGGNCMAFRRELYGHLLFGKTNVNFEESYKSMHSSLNMWTNIERRQWEKENENAGVWISKNTCTSRKDTGNLEVKSFYSDPARRNVGFFHLKWKFSQVKEVSIHVILFTTPLLMAWFVVVQDIFFPVVLTRRV